jgi:hypothetical protein
MIAKKTDFNPPVSIKAVKAKGRSVFLGNRFTDSDDWLKGLTVRLDNNSDKSFNYVRIEVQFNRPEGRTQDPPAIWYLEYGDYPFSYKTEQEIPLNRVKHVLPGESVEVSLGDRDFNEMERFLKNAKYPNTNAVQLRITTIGFSDGTFWIVGRIFRRDAESPSGWRPITPTRGEQVKQPRGSARNRTANFLDMQKVSSNGSLELSEGNDGEPSDHARMWWRCPSK